MSIRTLLTADQFELMPDDDSVRLELDEGEVIAMPPAGLEHADYESNICTLLKNYVRKHRLGKVYTGDGGFRLRDDTVRAPDVAFVLNDGDRFDIVVRQIVGKRLTWDQLTGKTETAEAQR